MVIVNSNNRLFVGDLQNNVVLLTIPLVSYNEKQRIDNKNSELLLCALFVNVLWICTLVVSFVIIHRNNWSHLVKDSILVNNR